MGPTFLSLYSVFLGISLSLSPSRRGLLVLLPIQNYGRARVRERNLSLHTCGVLIHMTYVCRDDARELLDYFLLSFCFISYYFSHPLCLSLSLSLSLCLSICCWL